MDFSAASHRTRQGRQARMLEAVGYASLDELTEAALPAGLAATAT